MMAKRTVRIFYSWQSDLPPETNQNAIRNAVRKAIKQLKLIYPNHNLVIDEATRETSGAINIASKIIEKLEAADVVVADVTSVTARRARRPCPNPNVSYELGFGVAQVGWDRVILLFNTALARFPQDLPFDLNQNRTSPYELPVGSPPAARAILAELLRVAIKAVIDLDPKRPSELKGLSPERIAHDHDVAQMKRLMSMLHLPTIDDFIEELPQRIRGRAIWYWEGFNGLMQNSLFELYDPVLKAAVQLFYSGWTKVFVHVDEYSDMPGGTAYTFSNAPDMRPREERQAAWDDILAARVEMRGGFDAMLERLRSAYLKVDIAKTNGKAHRAYIKDNLVVEKHRNKAVKKPAKRK